MSILKKPLILAVVFMNMFSFSSAQEEAGLAEMETLTGTWGGLRTTLEDAGIIINAEYKGEYWGTVGGDAVRNNAYCDNYDLIFNFDFERILGWTGGSLTFYMLGNNGTDINEYAMSALAVTNIAVGTPAYKAYSIMLMQSFFDDRLNIAVGTYDFNSEFDAKETGGLFINPSHGIGQDIAQTGENGPSIFPNTAPGIRIKARPYDNTYIQTVVLNAVAGNPENQKSFFPIRFDNEDGIFAAAEFGYDSWEAVMEANGYRTKAGIGYWMYTATHADFFKSQNNYGIYMFFDQDVYRENEDEGLSFYGRFGVADDQVNMQSYYFGTALVYTGLFPSRESDQLGLAYASVHNSHIFMLDEGMDNPRQELIEQNIEVTYLLQVTPAIGFQPNVQYFIHPTDMIPKGRAIIAGARLILSL